MTLLVTDASVAARRIATRGARAALLAASFAIGVGAVAQAQDVQRGGTVVLAEWLAVPSLDPHLSNSIVGSTWSNIFDSLFTYIPPQEDGEGYDIGPGLATSFERLSPTEIELTLREGVTFHDGTPLDAEAVKWNLERARDNEISTRKQTVESLTDVTVVDDHTLRLKFSVPQPLFDVLMSPANPANIYFVSPTAVEEMGDEAFARAPVGSGPFRVVEWVPDDKLELEAVENHWQTGVDGEPLPYADELVIRFIPDQTVGALELRAGTVHVTTLLPQDMAALRNSPDIGLYRVPLSDKAYPSFYITSNPDSDSPFAHDVRLRQAVQYAINREAIAKVVGGEAEPHYYWGWYPGVPGYDESLPHYEYNPEKAKALLAEAGYADGIDLEVKVPNRPLDVQPLEIMQAMLGEVGIRLKISVMDRTPWVDAGRSGNFEALSHGNTANIDPLMRRQTDSESSSNWARYFKPEVDALWDEAEMATSTAERADIYREMQRIMYEDAFHIIAYRRPIVLGYSKKLHNIERSYGQNMRYVWLEQ
ncbi:ABC transporter substrate-binding protein [Psychromarinibacter sp. C21-152]|uniref:ABC transporter substrate-binding protein n=1 Tax=Psychromarinibacter sediminicola TaxID=3033385 RepID=A0AAE3NSJ3_9RHOB|nr:ABC transporter substrate-binding protein [Psychromarinibacter sediminicola]MDF0601231.1 ABC transporter substrate-binding protein [Psychromarinibacter sediminicola]